MSEENFSIETGIGLEDFEPIERGRYLRHKIVFRGEEIYVDLEKELQIDEGDLVKCMSEHVAIFAYWIAISTLAKRFLRERKARLSETTALLDAQAREKLIGKEIKVTEDAVKNLIRADVRYREAASGIKQLEDMVELTEGVLLALEHRREMLREINRAQRTEYYQK